MVTGVADEKKNIDEFLQRELPPGATQDAPYIGEALHKAAERYDRYFAAKADWRKYPVRRKKLAKLVTLLEDLASGICDLDILSRDDLENRVERKKVEELVGSLHFFSKQLNVLVEGIQKNGRSRDLAEERWIK